MYRGRVGRTAVVGCLAGGVWLGLLGISACAPTGGDAGMNTNSNDNENENENENENMAVDVPGQPLARFETAAFSGSGNCAVCHNNLSDAAGNDVSIANQWRATMMAHAARDPFFLASVQSEVLQNPALSAVIEEFCANCHMPMARTQAVAVGGVGAILGGGFINPDNDLHEAAQDGVSCTLCHQIQDDFLFGGPSSFNGGYVIDTSTDSPDRIIFGPYAVPQETEVMQGAVGFIPAGGEHIMDSGLCATCHTLFTPVVDGEGQLTGETFPEQVQFLEWQFSEFGDGIGEDRSCQACHMPDAEGEVVLSLVPTNLSGREPFAQHVFLGGNVFMLRLLRDNSEELGLTASTEQFDDAIARTEEFLATETATLAFQDVRQQGGGLVATVMLTNHCGHKLPTGFPSRRAWIHFTVRDGTNTVVFESGAPLPDGRIAGDDADVDAGAFESHHDVIVGEDQVQIYQSIMENTDGEPTYVLLRAANYAKDNRLLPSGFNKNGASADIAVVGSAATDTDFRGGSDEVTYNIDLGETTGPFTVTAELLFQSVSYRFVEQLRAEDGDLTRDFVRFFDAADRTPALIATVSQEVP